MTPLLLVFGGLPGVGKTAVSRAVADALGACWLRLDTVEVALRDAGLEIDGSPGGYVVLRGLATDQLRLDRAVVADAVHPVRAARSGWVECARASDAMLRFVEVRCTDAAEHRRRVEARRRSGGVVVPTWDEVRSREYEPWDEQRLIVENDGTVARAAQRVVDWLAKGGLVRAR